MRRFKILLNIVAMFIASLCAAQDRSIDSLINILPHQKADTNKVNTLLLISKTYAQTIPDKAITYGKEARDLAVKLNFKKGEAYALKNIGIGYYVQANNLETLDYWAKSIEIFKAINDKLGVANMLNNIGALYSNQSDDAKALEYYLQSLKISEEIGDTLRMATALQNIGNTYSNKKATYSKALSYLSSALPLSEALKNQDAIVTITTNMGEVFFNMGKIDSALYYYNKSLKASQNSEAVSTTFILNDIGKAYGKIGNYELALQYQEKAIDLAKRLNAKLYLAKALLGIADTYYSKGDLHAALSNYKEAQANAQEVHATYELKDAYAGLARTYSGLKDYPDAFNYQTLYANFKDTLYNLESDKKLASLQFDFDLTKKQGQIDLLTKDKTLSEVELNRQRFARNALIVGFILLLIIAFFIYRNYRIKAKTNKILDKQKDEIEHLLLNILPSEVAHELQTSGYCTPRHYDNVSVLFADFKGFTSIADKLTPEELVKELNTCFIAFDNIIDKYGLEKIKTIGDLYMCGGGIPTKDEDHLYKIIKAGLEIQWFVEDYNQESKLHGQNTWDVRVGIHAGPVVAGVVGKKKYAYDIWGNTVNIASRMESNGEAKKVNISQTVYEQVSDRFECHYRGKIHAKNVGEIDMYFVEKEISPADVMISDIKTIPNQGIPLATSTEAKL